MAGDGILLSTLNRILSGLEPMALRSGLRSGVARMFFERSKSRALFTRPRGAVNRSLVSLLSARVCHPGFPGSVGRCHTWPIGSQMADRGVRLGGPHGFIKSVRSSPLGAARI